MGRLCNLKLEEFSIVRGDEVRPANPGAVVTFFKSTKRGVDDMRIQKTEAAAAPGKQSLREKLAAAISGVVGKAVTTYEYSSSTTSKSTETTQPDAPGQAPAAEGAKVILVESSAPAAPAAQAKTEPAAAPEVGDDVVVKALSEVLEPITKSVTAMDSRLAKLEKAPAGSRVIKFAGLPAAATFTDSGDAKFPQFTKFLAEKAGLTSGQRLTKTTLSSSGWTYGLSFTESGNFIDYIVDQAVLLKQCRTVKMPDKKYPIDKIGLGGNVLVKGTPGQDPGDTVTLSGPTQVLLDAQEVLAIVSIGDDTLEDNIEGEAFVQHLLGMIARSAANELEQACIHGDVDTPDAGIMDRFDGWLKLAAANGYHAIDAMGDADRYWPGLNGAKAARLLKALPTKYRQDYRTLSFLLHNDLYIDYQNELAGKVSPDAFAAITGSADMPIRGVKNVRVPMMKTNLSFTSGGQAYTDGAVVLLTDLRNLIFGIHREIKIEPFRQPRKRCTDYVLSMRCDAKIENGDAIAAYTHAMVKEA